jgi:hypothetical protein
VTDPLDFDDAPSERVWFRSTKSGNRGYLVKRDGKDMIHLDVNNDYHVVPMSSEWQPDRVAAKMSPMQRAQVAYAADCELRKYTGERDGRHREWNTMLDEDRISFMDHGPAKASRIRVQLWKAIMETISDV